MTAVPPPLLFVHGWGFAPGFWDPVVDNLPGMEEHRVDLGFYGPVRVPEVKRPLVVAHSMGLAWALAHIPRPWAGVLAVNGVLRFCRSQHFIEGVAPRMVERMQARFVTEPEAVLGDFLGRCGIPDAAPEGIEPRHLGEALAWLGKCDERTAYLMLSCPRHALAGLSDPIVPEEMSRASFPADELVLAEGGGHLLPLTHPGFVASRIRNLSARIAVPG